MASDNGSFFSGLLIGSAIGAIAGVLFAPKSGRDLREGLITDNEEIINKAKSELDKMRSELGDLKDKISKTMDRNKTATKPAETEEERDYEASLSSLDEDTSAGSKKKTK
ncbi:MAG: YtxH domain-containing protein [Calditrichaeota bacterium]|nr:MAG: YtxH domain-containing protein [Calditrichota bacterium]MBL1204854.1 YtxH domain-containing protein [Calditrichota bacterium]NOG44683.1 YtxH domain-containing protein [Calditrichota bacterium]